LSKLGVDGLWKLFGNILVILTELDGNMYNFVYGSFKAEMRLVKGVMVPRRDRLSLTSVMPRKPYFIILSGAEQTEIGVWKCEGVAHMHSGFEDKRMGERERPMTDVEVKKLMDEIADIDKHPRKIPVTGGER